MPSKRKRIGFLPREEVKEIIDKICEHNKLSQSKVTGILVEEALNSRGVLNKSLSNKSSVMHCNNYESLLVTSDSNNKTNKEDNKLDLDDNYIKDEVQMINDFIEFKFFKNIMKQNNIKTQ